MLQQKLLKKKTDISSCEINIGSCSGVNMCHKLGHIDLWDTTFAFVLVTILSLHLFWHERNMN
jgi:hypothetical protein